VSLSGKIIHILLMRQGIEVGFKAILRLTLKGDHSLAGDGRGGFPFELHLLPRYHF
jgi:hypothetical protein